MNQTNWARDRIQKALKECKKIPRSEYNRYDITGREMDTFYNMIKLHYDEFRIIGYIFQYGFVKGMRYQRAKQKK